MKKPILFALVLTAFAAVSIAAKPPNILLILTDDHGWSQLSARMDPGLSASMSKYLETPNMNRIMNEGMRFTSGYSPAPLCTPTRRSIQCGTTAARSGTEFKSPWVPAKHMTIPKALKRANEDYRCAHFGKWGEQMISTPEECGYHASDGMTGNNTGGMPKSLGVKGGHEDGPPHFIDNKDPKRTPSMTTSAIAFMRKQARAGRPFYIQASYYAQHLSVVCAEETLGKYEAKGIPDRGYPQAWAAMMEELDQGVGRLLDTLDELGIADTTYVFFSADNGGRGTVPGGDVKRRATNHPLTGAKHSLYEGGIRVPFMVRGPGVKAGSVSRVPVAGYDFLPTFYDLAGGSGSLSDEIDGASFKAVLRDPTTKFIKRPNDALIFHRPGKFESAIRQGRHKLFVKWTAQGKIAAAELYVVDPNPAEEGRNLAAGNPKKVAALRKELVQYLASVDAEKPKPRSKKRPKGKRKAVAAVKLKPVRHLIDTHIHLYDPRRDIEMAWPPKSDKVLYKPHLPAEYSRLAKAAGVTGVVVVEASTHLEDNRWVLDLVEGDDFYVGLVGNIDINRSDFEKQLRKLKKDKRFVGVRPRNPKPIDYADPKVLANLRALAKHDLTMDYLTNGGGIPGIEKIDHVARAIPDLRIVVNHCFGYDFDGEPPSAEWIAAVKRLAANPNVTCKISGLYQRSVPQPAPQNINHYRSVLNVLWQNFGKKRLIYGSNWPVTKHTDDYASFLKLVDRFISQKGQDAREHYYWKNAAAAYRLSLK